MALIDPKKLNMPSKTYCRSRCVCQVSITKRIAFIRLNQMWKPEVQENNRNANKWEDSSTNIHVSRKAIRLKIHANYGANSHNGKKTNNHRPDDNFFFRYGVTSSFINWCVISKAIPTQGHLIKNVG